ncbi:DHH family phosphoesterase [Alkalibacillus haloalkaliphilus]|uniref:Bifunctional oligoribonuclease and PAP phosphatase NrnA n=1 Tax=Alkalibacillus haloalkaliphilus TaxID=94136 RepID=A0A511W481_9BACI|nr:bifunctional oligoribonuclease/PAP phosphatase NrnA [Alkalibacillus haloalkaliphilus]GEN45899.1 bifunctional oligoribonuclease and PAP phosphatase NrnA [Alkalibacillus haloalkaliphilus]
MKTDIIKAINDYNTIIIHRHVRPDPDAYGSQVGLAKIIQETYRHKDVYVVGEEDTSLNYLARLDDIEDDQYKGALVIVCDTANEERICDQRYNQGAKLIKIDHHPNREPYGDMMWVDTDASSTSEMIYELYLEGKSEGWTLNQESARLLYAGIVGDTGRFLFPSTTERTFNAAQELVTYNFDRKALYDNMYQVSINIAKFKGELLSSLEPRESGLAVFKLPKELLDEYGVSADDTHTFVGIAGDIKGIHAWVFFVEEDDVIRVRLRSKGPVINEVAAQFNGGGHPMASGAKVFSWDEADQLVESLDQVCREFEG